MKLERRNKKKDRKDEILIDPVPDKLKGFTRKFDNKLKDKVYSNEEIDSAIFWIDNMEENLENVLPTNRIKLLFDKWVIIQNNDNSEVYARRRKVQDEAISIADNIKEFDLIAQIAKSVMSGNIRSFMK
jgi:hypothetical protein